MKKVLITVLVVLLVISFGCKKDNSNPSETPSTGIISGRVTDPKTGTGIDNATIITTPLTITVLTNTNGDFTIPGIQAGAYKVKVSKTGYADDSVSVTVAAGKTASANLVLIPTASPTFPPIPPVLTSPSNGATGIGIPPTLNWNVSTGAASYRLQVATNGSFTNPIFNDSTLTGTSKQVTGLSNSTQYYWRVNAKNSYGTSSYSSVYSFTTVAVVAASISGTVKDNSNQAISGAKVYTSPVTSTVYSDASGNYSISNISAGTYTVYAERTGFNDYSMTINVSQGQAYTQNIIMTPSGTTGTPCPGTPTVYDPRDGGKTYNTVQIGSQCWLKENLDVGSRVNGSQNQSKNSTIEKYCYNDDPANCATYGGLYQWNEVMQYVTTPGARGICPTGWHIPTIVELEALSTAVGDNSNALKAVGQGTGSGQGTNTSGYSALLAGYRNYDGTFYFLSDNTNFWSSTEYGATHANTMYLYYGGSHIYFSHYNKEVGFSVRCAKDN